MVVERDHLARPTRLVPAARQVEGCVLQQPAQRGQALLEERGVGLDDEQRACLGLEQRACLGLEQRV